MDYSLKFKADAGLSSLNPEVIISQPDLGKKQMNNLIEVFYQKKIKSEQIQLKKLKVRLPFL